MRRFVSVHAYSQASTLLMQAYKAMDEEKGAADVLVDCSPDEA